MPLAMDRLVVALLNTGAEHPDPLETPLGTARWWAGLAVALPPMKPRFDGALSEALRELRVAARKYASGDHGPLPVRFRGDATDAILFEVAHAIRRAADDGTLRRVRQCTGRACGRYFLDDTKNRSRRWCSLRCMERARAPRRRTISR